MSDSDGSPVNYRVGRGPTGALATRPGRLALYAALGCTAARAMRVSINNWYNGVMGPQSQE